MPHFKWLLPMFKYIVHTTIFLNYKIKSEDPITHAIFSLYTIGNFMSTVKIMNAKVEQPKG